MSSLTDIDKRYLERLLGMSSGYVLDFSDNTYGEFFGRHRKDIHCEKYQTYGTSKAKKMRSFWEQEGNAIVGPVLPEMLDSYVADCELNGEDLDQTILDKCLTITNRLLGRKEKAEAPATEDSFLDAEFFIPNVGNLPIDALVVPIIEERLPPPIRLAHKRELP